MYDRYVSWALSVCLSWTGEVAGEMAGDGADDCLRQM